MATAMRCPTCSAVVKADGEFMPFCSQRCRQIDLGRWLGEHYSVPIYREDEEQEDDTQRRDPGEED